MDELELWARKGNIRGNERERRKRLNLHGPNTIDVLFGRILEKGVGFLCSLKFLRTKIVKLVKMEPKGVDRKKSNFASSSGQNSEFGKDYELAEASNEMFSSVMFSSRENGHFFMNVIFLSSSKTIRIAILVFLSEMYDNVVNGQELMMIVLLRRTR